MNIEKEFYTWFSNSHISEMKLNDAELMAIKQAWYKGGQAMFEALLDKYYLTEKDK